MNRDKKQYRKNLWAPWRMEYIISARDGEEEGCIFCNRINRKEDKNNLILWRGKLAFIIMNRFPYNNGHLMIVPNRHGGDLSDVTEDEHRELFSLIILSKQALENVMRPHGFNIGMNSGQVAGAGVDDHVHYHIVPRWNGDTNFMPVLAHTKVVSESLPATYKKLRSAMKKIMKVNPQ